MTLIKVPTPDNILLAARNLKNGAIVGLPTETVYGLAADAENEMAVRRVYELKKRPLNHPLIVHLGQIDYLEKWALEIPKFAWQLADEFWPGPLTMILKRSKVARDFITGSQNSIAVRMPANAVAIDLLNHFHMLGGNGVAAPSANKFGSVTSTSPQEIEEEFSNEFDSSKDLILDDGYSKIGVESTIVDLTDQIPKILRNGIITCLDIERTLDVKVEESVNTNIRYPGKFEKHYSPRANVEFRGVPSNGDGYLALAEVKTPSGCIRLNSPSDSLEFAFVLYRTFRLADQLNLKRIFVNLPEGNGIEVAIRERVIKAANGM